MGRDLDGAAGAEILKGFNPRARMGRDHSFKGFAAALVVSIHAPAWGATQ